MAKDFKIPRPFVDKKNLVGVQHGGTVWRQFKKRFPHLADDLYEEMIVAVMNANKALEANGRFDDPKAWAYRRQYVRGALSQAVARVPTVSLSAQAYRNHVKAGKTIKKVNPHQSKSKMFTREINTRTDRRNDLGVLELKELIYSCCSDDRERVIVDLLLQGYDQTEMLEVLPDHGIQIKRSRLGQIIEQYRSKLERVLEWKPPTGSPLKNGESVMMNCSKDCPRLTESLPPKMGAPLSLVSSVMQAMIPSSLGVPT